jgi:hypothetical protein
VYPPALASKIPIICIPTSLQEGEYSVYSGTTDDETHTKYQFCPPLKSPSLIILSETVTRMTPLDIWLQSGIRGVDHCVKAFYSTIFTEEVDESATKGLQCLIPGLLKQKLIQTMRIRDMNVSWESCMRCFPCIDWSCVVPAMESATCLFRWAKLIIGKRVESYFLLFVNTMQSMEERVLERGRKIWGKFFGAFLWLRKGLKRGTEGRRGRPGRSDWCCGERIGT